MRVNGPIDGSCPPSNWIERLPGRNRMEKKTELQAKDLRGKAIAAAEAHTKSALALGEILFQIYYGSILIGNKELSLAQAWKFENFHEYVESELGMHGSTAYRYVMVHDTLVLGAGIDQQQLPKSITKLMQLARLARSDRDQRGLKGWLKKANEMTCCEFEAEVDEALGGKGGHKQVSFYMRNAQATSMYRHIKRAKEVLGTHTNGETLSEILTQWSDLQASTTKLRKVAS